MTRSRERSIGLASLAIALFWSASASAQSAAVRGRIVDEQQRTVSGAIVSLTNPRTGTTRTDESDGAGVYRFEGLSNGIYDIIAARAGFSNLEQRAITVQVGAVVYLDFAMHIAAITETVTIVERNPLVQASSAAVSSVVEPRRIEELPLNGRQFANLAATLPGVGIAFHRDPSKGTQYSPQVSGGTGRHVNYLVDGGDNNDDTVGGQLQLFPLDAIEEFRFSIASYSAENGRASGGVMNAVTKSGTNRFAGSGSIFARDDAMNGRTTTEERANVPKPDYKRWQFGASIGGPIRRNVAHFFAAVERIHQDTFQAVDTQGLFPALDGVFPLAYRETLVNLKTSLNLRGADHAWVRYGGNTASQPAGAGARIPRQSWGDNRNRFHSINARYARILGTRALNELTFQYSTFLNTITSNTTESRQSFPNGVVTGVGFNIPQATEQRKLHLRDDVSMQVTGRGGLGHGIKSGVSVAYDPHLGFPAHVEAPGFLSFVHTTDDPRGPLASVGGNIGTTPLAFPALETPLTQIGAYVQDDWRVTSRLTVNAGVRYDVAIGYQIDQSKNPNFRVLQDAGRAGRFAGVIGMGDFSETPRNDYDNIQPRIGFALDVRGEARDVVRGSWGIYTDTAYTNSNILFAAFDASGLVTTGQFLASNPNGLRNPDGSFYRVGDPISNIASLNEGGATGLVGEVVSPRLQQPYSRQASFGWSHQLTAAMAFSADVVHADGRDLHARVRLNSRPDGGPLRFADLALDPNSTNFRVIISRLRSTFDALLLSLRRRSVGGIDLALNYTLSSAESELGQGLDETGLGPNTIQDTRHPFGPVQFGPASTDARHLVSLSAIIPLKWQVQVAPIYYYRSALPVFLTEGIDRNRDSVNNDIPDRAFAYDGLGQPPREIGACLTVNCGRGAAYSQFNLRLSKRIVLHGGSRLDLITEVFNLFDASNPSAFVGRRLLGSAANPIANSNLMQPASFAGDFQRPEQRVGQVAVRWSF
jgi:hypothetical protein